MSGDLIDTVETLLQSRLGKRAADVLGVPAANTQTALHMIAPTIMAGVAEQCASVDQADDLLTTLRGARKTDPTGDDLIQLLGERAPHVGARAPTFLSQLLFGAQEDAVVEAIAAASALETRPVLHLLEVSIMASFSVLRDHAREEGWDGARMRQALQLERMLIKMELERGIAKATGFDWLASDDPAAPLFAVTPAAPAGQTPSGAGSPVGVSDSAAEVTSSASRNARPKDSSPRARKSIVDLLHARMAQGSLPASTPAASLNAGPAAGNSVYAQRRLDEWLEPKRRSALGPVTAESASAVPSADLAESIPPVPSPTQIQVDDRDLHNVDGDDSVAQQSDAEAVRDVRLEIKTAIELEQTWPRNLEGAPLAEDVAQPDEPAVSIPPASPSISVNPGAVAAASPLPIDAISTNPMAPGPTDAEHDEAEVDDALDFEKTMPLPFDLARHMASPRWPFSIFACRDPIYLDAPESYASRLPARSGAAAPKTDAQQPRPPSTVAHPAPTLAQSALPSLTGDPERAVAGRTAPAITRPAVPSPTIFSDAATDALASDPKPHPTKSISNWWLGPVVIVAAVVALVILSYRISGQRAVPAPAPPSPAERAVSDPTPVPAAPTGVPSVQHEAKRADATSFTTVTLPGGAKLNVRTNGFIAGLASALGDAAAGAGQRFVMDEISFDRDTAMLAPGSDGQLRQLTELLEAYPNAKIRIEGHTDRDGDTSVIRALSADRAASVKASLIMNGISEDRVQSQGFGADKPLSTSTSAQERAQNRRVEIVIVDR